MMQLAQIKAGNIQLCSERLQLTLMTAADWPNFYRLQSDPVIMQHIGPILSEAGIRAKFDGRVRPWNGQEDHWQTLIIRAKSNLTFIGSIGFRFDSIDLQRVELGYLILSDFNGKGYVTEAGKALVDFLFNQIQVKKIMARCLCGLPPVVNNKTTSSKEINACLCTSSN